jgi:hypothetical protein
MTESPLIYTIDGNVPADSLDYKTDWYVSDEQIRFTEEYRPKGEDRIVKRNVHIMQRTFPGAGASHGQLN